MTTSQTSSLRKTFLIVATTIFACIPSTGTAAGFTVAGDEYWWQCACDGANIGPCADHYDCSQNNGRFQDTCSGPCWHSNCNFDLVSYDPTRGTDPNAACQGSPTWACNPGDPAACSNQGDCAPATCEVSTTPVTLPSGGQMLVATGAKCTQTATCSPPPPSNSTICSVGGPPMKGDPFGIARGEGRYSRVDFSLSTPAGPVSFERHYVTDPEIWRTPEPLGGLYGTFVPSPFGSADGSSLQWWHNYYSMVTPLSWGGWAVHLPSGEVAVYKYCEPNVSGCFSTPIDGSRESHYKFYFDLLNNQIILFSEEGRLIYGHTWNRPGESRPVYFLSRIEPAGYQQVSPTDSSRISSAVLSYGSGTPNTCWGTSGTGLFLDKVRLIDGSEISFAYRPHYIANSPSGQECVLDRVDVQPSGATTRIQALWFTYDPTGRLASSRSGLAPSLLGASRTDTYQYDSFGTPVFEAYEAGVPKVRFQLATTDGRVLRESGSVAGSGWQTLWTRIGQACAPNASCSVTLLDRLHTTGDGNGYVTTLFTTASLESPSFTAGNRVRTTSTTDGTSTTTQSWQWQAPVNGLAVNTAERQPNGTWTGQTLNTTPVGIPSGLGFAMPTDIAQTFRGASTSDGQGALETVSYEWLWGGSWTGNSSGAPPFRAYERLPHRQTRPSTYGLLCPSGPKTEEYSYDAHDLPVETVTTGCTRTSGDWNIVSRHIGTQILRDNQGRITTLSGPGKMMAFSVPDSVYHYAFIEPVPARTLTYWPPGSGTNSERLRRVSGSGIATTEFSDYDVSGNPKTVFDVDNGTTTRFTYEGGLVTSRTTATGALWTYSYDQGRLHAITSPTGAVDVFCHHIASPYGGSGCDLNATTIAEVRARFTARDIYATQWNEAIEYEYWPDGSVRRETYIDSTGAIRKVISKEADARGRPSWEQAGIVGAQGTTSVRGFNDSGLLAAVGKTESGAPARCGLAAPGVTEPNPLCAAFQYDAIDRLSSMREPARTGEPATYANLNWDTQGNLAAIQSGCGAMSPCPYPALSYETDDFGNVVGITAPNTVDPDGPVSPARPGTERRAYDSTGHLVWKKTPAMTGNAGGELSWSYDRAGRLLTLTSTAQPSPQNSGSQLLRLTWDGDAASVPSDCGNVTGLLTNTYGRLASAIDPVWKTWFGYDAEGRKTYELKVRTPGKFGPGLWVCSFDKYLLATQSKLTYTPSGHVATVTYPHGRMIAYNHGWGEFADQVVSVDVQRFTSVGVPWVRLVSNVKWEPFGGLRAYDIVGSANGGHVEYRGGRAFDVLGAWQPEPVDATGRLRAITVNDSAGLSIFSREYQWSGDEIIGAQTTYKGLSKTTQTETYQYDIKARLTKATMPQWGITGGAYGEQGFTYDSRGNRTSTSAGTFAGYSETMDTGARPDELLSQSDSANPGSPVQHTYSYNQDGQLRVKRSAMDSSGTESYSWVFDWGEATSNSVAHGLETVMRAVAVNGTSSNAAWYLYFYDIARKRTMKMDPLGREQFFFWSENHELLEDVGAAQFEDGFRPVDEYVWLGGRPVAVLRGGLESGHETGQQHIPENEGRVCQKDGEEPGFRCQGFFLVTDVVGRPLVSLEADNLLISGVGEYQPHGHVNRVTQFAVAQNPGTYSTYSAGGFGQPPIAGLKTRLRVHFAVVDANETVVNGQLQSDVAWLGDSYGSSLDGKSYGGPHRGDLWTDWVDQPAADRVNLWWRFASGNCWTNGICGSNPYPYLGFAVDGYEYERHEPTAQAFFPPLRADGQYHDAESDLFENWNRFYDAATGRYLSPEPMLHSPAFVSGMTWMGLETPTYAYALNSPILLSDETGLQTVTKLYIQFAAAIASGNWKVAQEVAQQLEMEGDSPAWFFRFRDAFDASNRIAGPCLKVAADIAEGFRRLGQSPQTLRCTTSIATGPAGRIGFDLGGGRWAQAATNGLHEAVLLSGRVYDAFTGPAGMALDEYKLHLQSGMQNYPISFQVLP